MMLHLYQYAVYCQHTKIVQLLIENGANVNHIATDISPLGIAIQNGNLDIVKILVTNGADLSYGIRNMNAFEQAKHMSQNHIYNYLIKFQTTPTPVNHKKDKIIKSSTLFFQDINMVEMQNLIINRHNSDEAQREYDKRYGLISINKIQ